jgi:hypothetical protein
MRHARLGEMHCNGVPVFVQEAPVNASTIEPGDSFHIELSVEDRVLRLGLEDIGRMKRLLHIAEQHILLRQEQAFKSRNLTLDL